MKFIKNITLGIAALASVAMTACKDDFMETAPTGSVSDAIIQADVNNIYLAINGIQKEMVSQETGYQALGGEPGFMFSRDWQADDITCHAGGNWWSRLATWQYIKTASSGYNYSYYRVPYQWILNANKVLESLEAIDRAALSAADQSTYDQCKGEALTFRAFAHYELVQMYAKRYVPGQSNSQDGVIYRKSSTIEQMARESVEDVYKDVEADLAEAASLLAGIDVNDVNHFSSMSVAGFQARVALTKGEYAKAAQYAEQAIASAKNEFGRKLMDSSNLLCGFANINDDTKEVMWGAMTPDDKTVYFYSFMAYMSWNFNSSAVRSYVNCINKELYETMSESDIRLQWFDPTGTLKGPASNFKSFPYQNRKFTARSSSNAVCHVAFMRLAEMYLIAAEGYARAGQEAQAKAIFTEFQVTRDPEYTESANSGEALITEIMNSRRVELWGEGQRMFDLKRLGQKVVRDSQSDASLCGFIEKESTDWVYEIPIHETDYNPACTKNY